MYILDTHTLLWYLTDSDKLPLETKNIITKDENLERIHNDPFDRIIICQTISNSATLITKDSIIPEYAIPTLWY